MYIHEMSKNTVVERIVRTVESRNRRKDRKSKQVTVPAATHSSLLTSTTTNRPLSKYFIYSIACSGNFWHLVPYLGTHNTLVATRPKLTLIQRLMFVNSRSIWRMFSVHIRTSTVLDTACLYYQGHVTTQYNLYTVITSHKHGNVTVG